ncbi:MAG TPA: hypothetical protein VHL10_00990 [Nitrososphaera sp.]|jgi:hypothetical protein|nr:hypothetical protein [Nitrososphaera sp.]
MVSFFTMTLVISILGLGTLFVLKQIEVSTGSVLFRAVRPQINRFFKTCLVIVERVIPGLAKEGGVHVFKRTRAATQVALAHAALRLETFLRDTLHTLRVKLNPEQRRGEASPFLKEVGEYKKQLESEAKEEAQNF